MAKKLKVNKDVCVGCGCCAGIAPDVFEMGDDGLAVVVADANDAAEDAMASCPVQAIEEE